VGVEDEYVGTERRDQRPCLGGGAGLTHDFDVRFGQQDRTHADTHNVVTVGQQNADHRVAHRLVSLISWLGMVSGRSLEC
jgi:hypothetical protein